MTHLKKEEEKMRDQVSLKSLTASDMALSIEFSTGLESRFHWLWLRENCHCAECHHPQTWERIVDTFKIDPKIKAESYELTSEGTVLSLIWPDGHKTEIKAGWLLDHAYDGHRVSNGLPEIKYWSTENLGERPSVEAADVMDSEDGLKEFITQLRVYGFSIVKNLATEMGKVEELAKRVGYLRDTHFGIDFTVESKPDPNNVAYTSVELKAHTDLPNLESPPGIQFLHCLQFEATGGESILVDGFAVADQLRKENPKAYDDLTRIPVNYRFVDKEWDLRWNSPAIRLDYNGEMEEIRYHNALTATREAGFDDMTAIYEGLRAYTEVLRRPEFELKFKLEPGEVMVFHNRRVLHGRGEFDPNSGPRMLRGCYVDCDQAWSKLRVLQGMNHL
ncbi:TauD/TfdA family dioxygenase [Curvivirga sp.]|uniref:TauD/TfdA family dioxygenase n=1 Tax=Curvivirga sp. TaxID=2856848 RepID=UPI003B5A0C4A